MKILVKKISPQEFDKLEKDVRNSDKDVGMMAETWKDLHSFFSSQSPEEKHEYFVTYFRLYTELTWNLLNSFERDVVESALKWQVPAACLLGFDVPTKLISYFSAHTIDKNDLSEFYKKLREYFLNSEAIMGGYQNNKIKVKDAILEIKKLSKNKTNSLERAATISKIRDVFVSNGKENISTFFTEDLNSAVTGFIDTSEFFLEVGPEDINSIIEMTLYPELYGEGSRPEVVSRQDFEKEKISLIQIKNKIDENFRKDRNGQFVLLEDVFKELDRLANENGDDRIRELYYFNEKTGKFEWNEELLKGV